MLPSYRSLDLGTIAHPKIVWVYEICWDRSMFISKPVQFYAEWPPNNFHDENSPGLPVQFLGFVCVNDSISMFHNPTFSCLNHLESPYFFPGKIKSLPFHQAWTLERLLHAEIWSHESNDSALILVFILSCPSYGGSRPAKATIGYACCTYCRHTRTAQGGGSFQDRNLIGELLWFVDGGANWWTEGCLTHVNTCSLSVLNPRPFAPQPRFSTAMDAECWKKKASHRSLKSPSYGARVPQGKKKYTRRRTSRVTLSLKTNTPSPGTRRWQRCLSGVIICSCIHLKNMSLECEKGELTGDERSAAQAGQEKSDDDNESEDEAQKREESKESEEEEEIDDEKSASEDDEGDESDEDEAKESGKRRSRTCEGEQAASANSAKCTQLRVWDPRWRCIQMRSQVAPLIKLGNRFVLLMLEGKGAGGQWNFLTVCEEPFFFPFSLLSPLSRCGPRLHHCFRSGFWSLIAPVSALAAFASLLFDPRSHKTLEIRSVSPFFYLFAHIALLSTDSFSSDFFSSLTALTTVAASVHKLEVWLLNFLRWYRQININITHVLLM